MKRTTASIHLLLGLCFLLLAGCAPSVQVATDYDRSANFGQFQTFSFFQDRPSEPRDAAVNFDTSLDLYLRNAIRQSLGNQGLRFDTTNPDLKVAYDVTVNTETEVNTNYAYAPGFGYGYSYWYGYRYNYGFNRFPTTYRTVNQYKEGTVVVDLINPDTNELVWRGVGEAAVDMSGGIEQEKINTIVSNILQKYPPNRQQ
ncbi:DUF4136 domain-containing protein [Pontibacter actiniarum]|nr:DUF4136 domain-containing protein [Pontibacter actiniarum]